MSIYKTKGQEILEEECFCRDLHESGYSGALCTPCKVDSAITDKRNQCAKIAVDHASGPPIDGEDEAYNRACMEIATAIQGTE